MVTVVLLQDLQNNEEKVTEVNQLADKLIQDEHPETETVSRRRDVSNFKRGWVGRSRYNCTLL